MSDATKSAARMTALSVEDVIKVLSRASGRPLSEEMLREDLASGAPANPDGTINLVHYAAWLVKSIADGA